MHNWQPTTDSTFIKLKNKIYHQIRCFFSEREILEVDTPCLSQFTVTDINLTSIPAVYQADSLSPPQTYYLQTSPEYAMKRLLSAGLPSIYQICKAFRNGEVGRYHNPEFTLLEWYRRHWNHLELMEEVDEFLQTILNTEPADRLTYQEIFEQILNINPHRADVLSLREHALSAHIHLNNPEAITERDTWLQLLMSELIEPKLGKKRPVIIFDFPASQAALARISPYNNNIAERFEVYYQGIELANGFHELTEPLEQKKRFMQDQIKRKKLGLLVPPVDQRFIDAIESGLPPCSGVALGVDRLIMLATKAKHIREVISFPFDIA